MNYDKYNREERAICAHLFRLLHERLDQKNSSPLGQLLSKLGLTDLRYKNIGIFCEVSIIRDAFQDCKPTVIPFMDTLTQIIMKQENVSDCRLYSQLPEVLNNPKQTHPRQIRQKASTEGIQLTESESAVYGALQGMFNAKPDLVITVDNKLLVFEAKLTESFDEIQLNRTKNITQVWSTMLYKDLGFATQPEYQIIKLGAKKFEPQINWSDILLIAQRTYSQGDRTLTVMESGVELLKQYGLE